MSKPDNNSNNGNDNRRDSGNVPVGKHKCCDTGQTRPSGRYVPEGATENHGRCGGTGYE